MVRDMLGGYEKVVMGSANFVDILFCDRLWWRKSVVSSDRDCAA